MDEYSVPSPPEVTAHNDNYFKRLSHHRNIQYAIVSVLTRFFKKCYISELVRFQIFYLSSSYVAYRATYLESSGEYVQNKT